MILTSDSCIYHIIICSEFCHVRLLTFCALKKHMELRFFDFAVIWYFYREDYYQEGNHVYPRLKVLDAFTRALTTWARWVDQKIDASVTQVFFRGYSITHFWYCPHLHRFHNSIASGLAVVFLLYIYRL